MCDGISATSIDRHTKIAGKICIFSQLFSLGVLTECPNNVSEF